MGFAFAFGVLIRVVGRRPGQAARRAFDLVAIAAATLLPASSLPWPSVAGLTQQAMFVIAYVWYAGEALLIGRNAAAVKASG